MKVTEHIEEMISADHYFLIEEKLNSVVGYVECRAKFKVKKRKFGNNNFSYISYERVTPFIYTYKSFLYKKKLIFSYF